MYIFSKKPSRQQQKNQQQQQHCDIEAAVAVALPLSPSSSAREQHHQHDGDPFHRRSSTNEVNKTAGNSDALSNSTRSNSDILSCDIPTLPLPPLTSAGSSSGGGGPPPRSRGLPITTAAGKGGTQVVHHEPKLLHPLLLKVPLHIRFGVNGLLSNVLFMVVYNSAVAMFEHKIAVPTIYSVLYFFYIPLNHLFVSLLVFGWPDKYLSSLLSNFPIGLTAIALGSLLTAYLERIHFSDRVDEFIRDNFTFSRMPPPNREVNGEEFQSEFWSSILVLAVTSIWTYVLSIFVNLQPTKSEKKEL